MNEQFLQFLEKSINELQSHRYIAVECGVDNESLRLHDDYLDYCLKIKKLSKQTDLAINYINLFQNDINQSITEFPYLRQQNIDSFLQRSNKEELKTLKNKKQSYCKK